MRAHVQPPHSANPPGSRRRCSSARLLPGEVSRERHAFLPSQASATFLRHPALPSLGNAGARTRRTFWPQRGLPCLPVGPWCAACGGGRYRPASRSNTPREEGGYIATTGTPSRCPPTGYGGSSRMLDLSPPVVGAKWVLCPNPLRPTRQRGAGDDAGRDRGCPELSCIAALML